MPTFTAIAFDLDNTLIDRDTAFLRLINDWLTDGDEDNGTILDEILKLDDHGHAPREPLFRYLAETHLQEGSPTDLWQRFQREFPHYFQPNTRLNHELTQLAIQRKKLAVLSNGSSKMQRKKLKNAGLSTIFFDPLILISEETGFSKPQPEAFHTLVDRLGVSAGDILFVGDHPETDIEAAKSCGLQTCLAINPLTGLSSIWEATI